MLIYNSYMIRVATPNKEMKPTIFIILFFTGTNVFANVPAEGLWLTDTTSIHNTGIQVYPVPGIPGFKNKYNLRRPDIMWLTVAIVL